MPRRKPIPAARMQFAQRQGIPIQERMQRNPGRMARQRMQFSQSQMARQARTQMRNPTAARAEARPRSRDARRQTSSFGELPSMRERAQTRPAGLKQEWRQSFWFQIPIVGGLVDLLRNLVYPQEHLRTMKRAFVGTGIGSIAKDRAMARLEQRRQEKQARRQQAIVQRNSAPAARNTIAGQRGAIARRQARGTQNYPRQKAA